MDYSKHLNKKAAGIKPSGIRKFFDIVSEKKDAISLGVGEPDFDTPWSGRNNAINYIRKGYTHYTSNWGLKPLRELISRYYRERYSLNYSAENEILLTIGGSEAIDAALRALLNEGDEVLIPNPSYVSYSPLVTLSGGKPVGVDCTADSGFKITPENLRAALTEKTKVLILSYPNNPTGAVMDRADYELIAPLIIENDLIVISDEIYSELTYGSRHVSPANVEGLKERTVVVNGFSKAFAMTGWRLGYALAPKEIIAVMFKIHQYGIMCAPTASQYAAIACLEECFETDFSVIEEMKEEYAARKRLVVASLKEMGIKCFEPRGAFYVFADVSVFGMDGEEFANKLLSERSVAVVPGDAFGSFGKNYVRISYAYSISDLEKALKRIKQFVENM